MQAFEQALKLGGAPRNLDNAVLGILMTVAAQAVKDNIKAKARAAGYDALPDAVFTTVKRHTNVTVSEILAAVR